MPQQNILLVEGDGNLGYVLKLFLERNNFAVTLVVKGQAIKSYEKSDFTLCIIDLDEFNASNFDDSVEIRKGDPDLPIIFLTSSSISAEVIDKFKRGMDHHISKPFNNDYLLYQVQAILRRKSGFIDPDADRIEFTVGKYHYNHSLRVLTFESAGIKERNKLTPKEARLLWLLCLNKNKLLSRSHALMEIWKEDNYFTGRSMDVFVTKLRKYLRKDSRIEIVNIHGAGFRLNDHKKRL